MSTKFLPPRLDYTLDDGVMRHDGTDVIYVGDARVERIYNARASLDHNNELRLLMKGRIAKKDEEREFRTGVVKVDLTKPQPAWVSELVNDALRRLWT